MWQQGIDSMQETLNNSRGVGVAKLTPEELKEARRQKAQQQAEEERRALEQAKRTFRELSERHAELEQLQARNRDMTKQREKIWSVVQALYDEIDKLAKKAPREPVSDLTIEMMNQAISSMRSLLTSANDEFADEIKILVPAGTPPETRDVLLILAQMRAALLRFREAVEQESSQSQGEMAALKQKEMSLRSWYVETDDENEDDVEGS